MKRLLFPFLTISALFTLSGPVTAALIFSDNFSGYLATGTSADVQPSGNLSQNYTVGATNGLSTSPSNTTGLSGSQGLVYTQGGPEGNIVRKADSINLTAAGGNMATIDVYFTTDGTGAGTASAHIGLVTTDNGSLASANEFSGRIADSGGARLQLRSANAVVLTDSNTLSFTAGSWYMLRYQLVRTPTNLNYFATLSLYASDTDGNVNLASPIDSISAGFAITSQANYDDTTLFAALRTSSALITGYDNFSLDQGASSIPEPGGLALGCVGLGALLSLRRRRVSATPAA